MSCQGAQVQTEIQISMGKVDRGNSLRRFCEVRMRTKPWTMGTLLEVGNPSE